MGVLPRVSHYTNLIAPWIMVIFLNTYFCSLHPWGQEVAAAFQRDFWMSRKFASLSAGLIYSTLIVCFMTIITIIRVEAGDLNVLGANFIGNEIQQGVIGGAMHVGWIYTKILCDWYVLKLFHFLGPPHRAILVPPIAPLHEFGVLRRLLFFLDDDEFAVLAISLYVSILFVLMPLSIGSIVLATVGGSYYSGNSSVILGYMMVLAIPFAYSGIFFTLCQNSLQAIVRWFLLGFHFITVELPYLLWVFCKNLSLIKDAFVICFKIGVMPWIVGCWLKICTSPMFGTTIFQRFEISFPWMLILQWLAGFCCYVHTNTYMDLIQEIIHKRAFSCLQDVTEPDYKVTKLNLGYTLFVLSSHGVLLVILFHLPIRAVTLISPSFFCLELWITDEKLVWVAFAIYLHFMTSGIRLLIKLTKPTIKLIVHNWIITVSSWLQLNDFLLVVPRGEGFHRADQNMRPLLPPRQPYDGNPWVLLYILAEGSMVSLDGSLNAEDGIKDQRDNRFYWVLDWM